MLKPFLANQKTCFTHKTLQILLWSGPKYFNPCIELSERYIVILIFGYKKWLYFAMFFSAFSPNIRRKVKRRHCLVSFKKCLQWYLEFGEIYLDSWWILHSNWLIKRLQGFKSSKLQGSKGLKPQLSNLDKKEGKW